MFRLRLLLTALVIALGVAAVALAAGGRHAVAPGARDTGAQDATLGPFQARGFVDLAGNPVPGMESYPDGVAGAIHWSLCPVPGTGACHPIPSKSGAAHPGPQPAGTVFKVIATWHGTTYSSTLTWHGRIHAISGPALHGRFQFGSVVTGSAATWAGGWGTEVHQLGIEACQTAAGTACVMLSGNQLQCSRGGACGSLGGVVGPLNRPNRARVGNWYTGWYLFALDALLASDISGAVGYGSPAAIPPWPINDVVARSRPFGPVTGPPPPRVSFLAHAQVRRGHAAVATVRCVVTCHAWVTVSLVRTHFRSGERNGWTANRLLSGSARVGVRGSIPRGPVAVTIRVGDGPCVQGHSVIGAASIASR